MAYEIYNPITSSGNQALENWFLRALEQRGEVPQTRLPNELPQNYALSSSGSLLDFGPTEAAWSNAPKNLQLDYANPVEVAGVGKGWLAKNDPTMTVYDNQGQRIASLGNDIAAGRKIDMSQAQLEHARLQNQKLAAEMRPKPMGPQLVDGQWVYPPSAERPGGIAYPVEGFQRHKASDAKSELAREQQGLAQQRVGELLGELRSNYEQLQQRGAAVSPQQSWLQNIRARAGSSAVGQMVGGAVGTQEQEIRDKIQMAKPLLINEIRAATGMSAKAMDSNAELQFYLQAATDPTRSIEANFKALDYLNKAYAGGRLGQTSQTRPQVQSGGQNEAIIQEALDAINRGADPAAVQERLRQMGIQLR